MTCRKFGRLTCALWLSASLLPAAAAGAKEGFGFPKKLADLMRTTPPAIFLMGTRIAVKVGGAADENGLGQRLERQLESELVNRDRRLAPDGFDPQILVEVSILQNHLEESSENRTETYRKQVGTDESGKGIYKTYEETVTYKLMAHNFSVAYKVVDQVKSASLDADSISIPFKGTFREGHGAPAAFSLENRALENVVDLIARRLTPSHERIGVLLPKGRLASIANFADAGLWSRYLEALEALPPSASPEDEAYRQYALGTAYEALGYEADDVLTTLKYLEQADGFYNQAIGAKPEEKYFSRPYDSALGDGAAAAPLERVRSALLSYRRIKDFQDNYDQLMASAAAAGGKDAGRPEAGPMDNAAVIRMIKAGLGDEIVLTAIESAPQKSFDISPGGLIDLSQAKVSPKIIARLQALAGGPPK